MACRFPNPIPSGTRVPQWALIDITVRRFVFFDCNVLTAPFSLRTIGMKTRPFQSVVRSHSLSFSRYQCLTLRPISRLPRGSSWCTNWHFWHHRFCVGHPQHCYIVTLCRAFLDCGAQFFILIEKRFEHGRHRRRRGGWPSSNLPRSCRDCLLPATAPSRGSGRRSAGCWYISAAHG